MLEYSITNVTFNNNEGCTGGEAFTIHLASGATNGNCYAENGMRCYGNGYYSSIPCYSQICNQHNNLPSPSLSSLICPTLQPLEDPKTSKPSTAPTPISQVELTSSVCCSGLEGTTCNLNCPTKSYIISITFASYGDVYGSCLDFYTGEHSVSITAYIQQQCINLQSCSNVISNSIAGDPYPDVYKSFAVQAVCGFQFAPSMEPTVYIQPLEDPKTSKPSLKPTTVKKKPTTTKRKPTTKKHYAYMTHSPSRKPTNKK